MKVLVTGGSGMVGYRLCEKFVSKGHEVDFTYLSNACDIRGATGHRIEVSSREEVDSLSALRPELIIHCAALTNVDRCEADHALAWKHNVVATENAVLLAKKLGAKITYLSTSNVFRPSQNSYSDSDLPAELPPNNYGRTKLEGEKLVSKSGLPFTILRIDQPYYWTKPWHKGNTVTRTLKKLRAGETVKEVSDWFNCPTFIPAFCDVAYALFQKKLYGVFNAAGPEYLSRYDWAKKTALAFGFAEEKIEPMESDSLNLPVVRPNIRLDSSPVHEKTGVKPIGIEDGLMRMKKDEKKQHGKKEK
ncbi:GDP-L-fucose synthase [uncultured archaeon]|nr:GDP-L-fucose synthase [uncultured archaeon]